MTEQIKRIFLQLSPEGRAEALAYLAALVREDSEDKTPPSPDSQA